MLTETPAQKSKNRRERRADNAAARRTRRHEKKMEGRLLLIAKTACARFLRERGFVDAAVELEGLS
jgi:hypothetical protein